MSWWRDAVVYQIYPRSFRDVNNDGEGDLAGITASIDYLRELGIDAIWLNPCYRSPMNDGGYDIADYRDIDARFGTLTDFDDMLGACHAADIRVIMDIVPNHCSSEHPWFQEALASAPNSTPWQRFHCVRGRGDAGELPPNNWQSVFSGPAWSPIVESDGSASGWWYLHLFDSTQPDFNWENAEVRAEFEDIIRFWLDRGVDGLRIDVATGLIKAENYPEPDDSWPHPHWDQDGVHEIYRNWRAVCNEFDDRVLIAEAILGFPDRLARYIRPDELHMAFNFSQLQSPWDAQAFRESIVWPLHHNDSVGAPTTWLLENHDIARAVSRYSGAPLLQSGESPTILDHVPAHELTEEQLHRGTRRARAAMLMSLALPGSFYLFSGGELGLPEVLNIPDDFRDDPVWHRSQGTIIGRDGCRVPLPWEAGKPNYGFNDGAQTWLPQPANWQDYAIDAQSANRESFLNFTRQAIELRTSIDASQGIIDICSADSARDAQILHFTRRLRDGRLLTVVTNFGDEAQSLPAILEFPGAEVMLASSPISDQVPANACVWLVSRPGVHV
jgi:alpha-glucosidase